MREKALLGSDRSSFQDWILHNARSLGPTGLDDPAHAVRHIAVMFCG
jgi:hypothetical protein